MYFKFNTKKEAFDFIQLVNKGENIQTTLDDTTTSYAQPIDLLGAFYVIADNLTRKYTDAQEFDPFAPIDTTPPALTPFACEIPAELQLPFRNGVFKLNGFEVPLDIVQNKKVVNIAYLNWKEFRNELDRKDGLGNFVHQALKDALMDLWDFVELHANTIEPWMEDPNTNELSPYILVISR